MKWEYKTVKMDVVNFENNDFELLEIDKFINQFGQIGWELISTSTVNNYGGRTQSFVLIFKRPLTE